MAWSWKPQSDPSSPVAPDERLSLPATLGIGVQHVLAMMGATLLVPALTGLPANTTLFFSAIGTALFLTFTGNRVPSYLGSSFAFLAPLAAAGVTSADGAPTVENIARGLGGVMFAGLLLFVVGLVVNWAGARWIERVMPPVVNGAIVALIGLNLAPVARSSWDASPWTAFVTLAAALICMVVFKGFLSRIAILVGAVVGGLFAGIRGEWAGAGEVISAAPAFGMPDFQTPTFDATILIPFIPVVLVLVAENIGHLKSVSAMTGRNLDPDTGKALMADGVATMLAGAGGGSGTTTYAENIGVMAATRVYSTLAYWVAAAAALLLSTVPKFGAVVATVPAGVIGGLSTLLFGLIAVLGARIWVQNKVDFSKPVNLATAGVALIMGAANYTIVGQDMVFEGIAMGTAAALIIFHGMNGLEKLRDKLSASTTA